MITGKCINCLKRTRCKLNNQFICGKCKQSEDILQRTKSLHELNSFDFGWYVG